MLRLRPARLRIRIHPVQRYQMIDPALRVGEAGMFEIDRRVVADRDSSHPVVKSRNTQRLGGLRLNADEQDHGLLDLVRQARRIALHRGHMAVGLAQGIAPVTVHWCHRRFRKTISRQD